MNCTDCQNLILQSEPGFEKHVETCDECKSFLSMHKKLMQFEPQKEKYPGKILFEELLEKASDKPVSAFSLRWAIPLAAAFLLIVSIFLTNTISMKKRHTGKMFPIYLKPYPLK